MVSNDMLLQVLRSQAWERAKGELQSVLWTYGTYQDGMNEGDKWEGMSKAIKEFIHEVEYTGWLE